MAASPSSTPTTWNTKPTSSKSSAPHKCPKKNTQTNNDHLNDIPCFSSTDELDELYKIQYENATSLQKLKQGVDVSAAEHEPIFVSREKLKMRHPQFANLTFKEIIDQLTVADKILPQFDEQVVTRETVDKLSSMGHCVETTADKGVMVTSCREGNVKMYYGGLSARLEPNLAEPERDHCMQEFRKTVDIGLWETGVSADKNVNPMALAGTETGEAECEEEETDFIQGTVAAWVVPDPDTTPINMSTELDAGKKQKNQQQKPTDKTGAILQKPKISYARMITMALENSKTGSLYSRDIFKFICETFPYFGAVPDSWKNAIRHTLSCNKRFRKVATPGTGGGVATYRHLWTLNPEMISKTDKGVGNSSLQNPVTYRSLISDVEKEQVKPAYHIVLGSNNEAFLRVPTRVEASGSLSNSLEGWQKVELVPLPKSDSCAGCFFPYDIRFPIEAPVQSKNSTELGRTLENLQNGI